MMSKEKMFNEIYFSKMLENFATFNTIGDIDYYSLNVGNKPKSEFFNFLLNDRENLNFIHFTVTKMKSSSEQPLKEFKEKFAFKEAELLASNTLNKDLRERLSDFKTKLEIIEHYVENLEQIFYDCTPEKGIIVLSHNDAHLINIMHTKDNEKVYLFDHEYSCYNFLGFDIANYIIEYFFYLADTKHPYYKYYSEAIIDLPKDMFYNAYLNFFELIETKYANHFRNYPDHAKLLEIAKTKEYYLRVMGLSSIMWSVFAVIYLDFDSVWNKTAYDYFNFAFDRLAIYHQLVRLELQKLDN